MENASNATNLWPYQSAASKRQRAPPVTHPGEFPSEKRSWFPPRNWLSSPCPPTLLIYHSLNPPLIFLDCLFLFHPADFLTAWLPASGSRWLRDAAGAYEESRVAEVGGGGGEAGGWRAERKGNLYDLKLHSPRAYGSRRSPCAPSWRAPPSSSDAFYF